MISLNKIIPILILTTLSLSLGCRSSEETIAQVSCDESDESSNCFVSEPLLAPAGVTATMLSQTSIHIDWTPAEFSKIVTVLVEYKKESETDYSQAAIVAESEYTLMGLTVETTYNIRLKSLSGSERSDYSEVVTQATDTSNPMPQSLVAALSGSTKFLTWTWSNSYAEKISSVLVQRKEDILPAAPWTTIHTFSADTQPTSYADTVITGSVSYRILANHDTGSTSGSNSSNKITVWSKIAAGKEHSCGITLTGGVRCWGDNENGQLGNGTNVDSSIPVPVSGISSGATSIATSRDQSCAVVSGIVKCWGKNNSGMLGNTAFDYYGSNVPATVMNIPAGATAVTLNDSYHVCAIVSGIVKCWGNNCLLYTSPSPRDRTRSRMPSSA